MAEEGRFEKNQETKEDANKWLIVIGLIVTGLLIGGGLVFAGYKLTQQKVPEFDQSTPQPTPEFTPTPAAEVPTTPEATPAAEPETPLSGWETYTNTDYGYQFKHPAGWIFTARMIATDPSKPLYVIRQEVQSNDIDDYLVSIRAWDNPDGLSLVDWIQFMKDSNAFATPTEGMDTTANTEVGGPASPDPLRREASASLGGEQALQFWSDPLSGGQEPGECFQACPILSIYFVHGDKAYTVELNYLREFDEDSFVLFSQFLSTFEFL